MGVGRGAAAGLPGNHHVHRLCLGSGGRRSPSARSWAGRSLRPQEGSVSRMPEGPRRRQRCVPRPAVRGRAQAASKRLRAAGPQSVTGSAPRRLKPWLSRRCSRALGGGVPVCSLRIQGDPWPRALLARGRGSHRLQERRCWLWGRQDRSQPPRGPRTTRSTDYVPGFLGGRAEDSGGLHPGLGILPTKLLVWSTLVLSSWAKPQPLAG